MGHLDVEASTEDSAPVELFEVTYPGGVTRYCGGYDSITIDANGDGSAEVYTQAPIVFGRMGISTVGKPEDFSATLPASDPLVQLYGSGPLAGYGPPPQEMLWRVWRYQPVSNTVEQICKGFAGGLRFKGRSASYRIASGTDDALSTEIPNLTLQKTCGAVLYDTRCGVVKASFSVDTTVSSVSGDSKIIEVAAVFHAFKHKLGMIEMLSNGEKRTIVGQSALFGGRFLTVNMPFRTLLVGSSVRVSLGCDQRISTCRDDFDNVKRFRGHPHAPLSNPFIKGVNGVSKKG